MKTKVLFQLAFLATVVVLFSCSKENEAVVSNDAQVEIDAGTQAGIQDFINKVNGVTTRLGGKDDNDQYQMRIYLTGASNCQNGDGYCLPEVIVTPGSQKPWIYTPEGSKLQDLVNNNQITVKKEFSAVSNTEFYIYNGVENPSLEIVVPVVHK